MDEGNGKYMINSVDNKVENIITMIIIVSINIIAMVDLFAKILLRFTLDIEYIALMKLDAFF